MAEGSFKEQIAIPSCVEVSVSNGTVKAKGKKGELERAFAYPKIIIKQEHGAVHVSCESRARKYKRMFYTFVAHIENMLSGVEQGYAYKMKICSGHFPMTVKVENGELIVSNFLGEKIPRRTKILENVKVSINGDLIIVESLDLDRAGQTAANIESATHIRNRDRRVFQDGIYIIEKPL